MSKILKIKNANKIAVFGDIHGDLESLTKGYNIIEKEGADYVIFLGDYADRGHYGPEVIEFVKEKQKKNDNVIPMKGNHEDYELVDSTFIPKFSPCDLIYQYEQNDFGSMQEIYDWFESLPLGVIARDKYFFVHGGISSKVDLKKLDAIAMEHLLWSDPTKEEYEYSNPRGVGVMFGTRITDGFKEKFRIKTIIRSHEPRKASRGYAVEQDGRILTISSTTVYGGKAAVLIIDNKQPAMDAYGLSGGIRII